MVHPGVAREGAPRDHREGHAVDPAAHRDRDRPDVAQTLVKVGDRVGRGHVDSDSARRRIASRPGPPAIRARDVVHLRLDRHLAPRALRALDPDRLARHVGNRLLAFEDGPPDRLPAYPERRRLGKAPVDDPLARAGPCKYSHARRHPSLLAERGRLDHVEHPVGRPQPVEPDREVLGRLVVHLERADADRLFPPGARFVDGVEDERPQDVAHPGKPAGPEAVSCPRDPSLDSREVERGLEMAKDGGPGRGDALAVHAVVAARETPEEEGGRGGGHRQHAVRGADLPAPRGEAARTTRRPVRGSR